jgi:hypothetical protein
MILKEKYVDIFLGINNSLLKHGNFCANIFAAIDTKTCMPLILCFNKKS